VLVYVFWHTPRGVDLAAYEAGLGAFHHALARHRPEGFQWSTTLRIERPPWLPDASGHYVDWYAVADFAALGALNEAAVSGARQRPHDAVAGLAGTGTAGLLAPIRDNSATLTALPRRDVSVGLLDKPTGQCYPAFHPALVDAADGGSCWQRQMTLGPGPEYVVVHDAALSLPWPTRILRGRRITDNALPESAG
jgi:hypothetical protein